MSPPSFVPRPVAPVDLESECRAARILDVRASADFAAGHLPGAGNVPFAELAARTVELPARDEPLLVAAGKTRDALEAALTLEGLGFESVAYLDSPLAAHPRALVDRGPKARLWSPAPFLLEVADRLPRGRALDVAAGSCRNAVYLAGLSLEAEAVDRSAEALARGSDLAKREGVTVHSWVQDLEDVPHLPEARYQVIVCFRFLFRPLFAAIERALAPGGHLVYETFRKGLRPGARPRRERFLLEPGELRAAFPRLVVLHESEPEPPDAPATARLWARKP